jgi:hypothetical protein
LPSRSTATARSALNLFGTPTLRPFADGCGFGMAFALCNQTPEECRLMGTGRECDRWAYLRSGVGPDEVRTANDANAKLGWAAITSVNFRVKGDIITLVRNDGKKLKERPR